MVDYRIGGILCNCGLEHPTVEAWQACPMALTPQPLEPWWRMSAGVQQMRSGFEKSLPEWQRDALDRARGGNHPQFLHMISREEARQFVNAVLPEGDPGRI